MLLNLCKLAPYLLPLLPTPFSWLCSNCAGSMVSWDRKPMHFQSDVVNTGCFNLDLFFSSALLIMVSVGGSRSKIIGRNKWRQAETGFLPFSGNSSICRIGRTKPQVNIETSQIESGPFSHIWPKQKLNVCIFVLLKMVNAVKCFCFKLLSYSWV